MARIVARRDGWRALVSDRDGVVAARGFEVAHFDAATWTPRTICTINAERGPRQRLGALSRVTRRVLRHGLRVGVRIDDARVLLASSVAAYEVDLRAGTWTQSRRFDPGRKVLSFAALAGVPGFEDGICYGEYGSTSAKPWGIWRRAPEGSWSRCFQFPNGAIDHIHGLAPDPARACVWVLTGDYGDAAALWRATDDFRRVEPMGRGQSWRTCGLFPTHDGLLYATDSHLQRNELVLLRLGPGGWTPSPLRSMVGSTLYAAKIGSRYVFTTAVEPGNPTGWRLFDLVDPRRGPGIDEAACEIVAGTPASGFATVERWRADRLPKRLFGFSTIHVPSGDGSAERLVVTGAGVRRYDEAMLVLDLA